MKKILTLLFLFCVSANVLYAQQRNELNTFNGAKPAKTYCGEQLAAFQSQSDIGKTLDSIRVYLQFTRPITAKPCNDITNFQAKQIGSRLFIFYNENFLKDSPKMQFSEGKLPTGQQYGSTKSATDWEKVGILCHEIGHLANFHQAIIDEYPVGDVPLAKMRELELEADGYAGAALYRLGASLAEAQLCMNSQSDADDTYSSHPRRVLRLAAIRRGYTEAERISPRSKPQPQQRPDAPLADSDGDGVPDETDPCPKEYGTANGCLEDRKSVV